jgi:hypothetical protein
MLGAFYHFRRKEWLPAAAWGLILGLTRPNGCLISIPLAVLALQDVWQSKRYRDAVPGLIVAAMPGIGMLFFSAYLYSLTGRPFVWLQAHEAWGRTYEGIDTLFAYHMNIIAKEGLYAYSQGLPTDMLNGLATVGTLLAVWPVMRRVGVAYGLLMLLMVLPPLMRGGFLSMGRVTSTLFPLFLYLGWRLQGMTRDTVLMAASGLQAFFAALFFTWRPLF